MRKKIYFILGLILAFIPIVLTITACGSNNKDDGTSVDFELININGIYHRYYESPYLTNILEIADSTQKLHDLCDKLQLEDLVYERCNDDFFKNMH
jgi:hypothetical protein